MLDGETVALDGTRVLAERDADPPQHTAAEMLGVEGGAAQVRQRLLAHLGQFLGAGVAAIGAAVGEHLLGDRAVARGIGVLIDDVAVPIEAEPGHAVQDRLDRGLGRAFPVGILDPKQHFSAGVPGIKPVEERRASTSDMQETSGRGGEACDDGR